MPATSLRLLPHAHLMALGRADDFSTRDERYRGDSQTVSMADFSEADRSTLTALYRFLIHLKSNVEANSEAVDAPLEALRTFLTAADYDALPARIAQLGARLSSAQLPEAVRQAFHDLRGGSLQALLMHLDLVLEDDALPGDLQRIFVLVRDHLKMMRNAVHDLDPAAYDADLQPKGHSVSLLEEKWTAVSYPGAQGAVQVRLHNEVHGDIAECCMEFSALDRVLYNLVNNAARYAADGVVDLVLLPVDHGRQLRFLVVNRVTDDHRRTLIEAFGGEDLGALLRGGFTTGGHGVGTRIVSEFVAHGYGLDRISDVIDGRYVGAHLVQDCFVSWFHWPAMPGEG